jgi:hypothetical protein
MQALIAFWRWLGTLYLVRKTGWRYGQMDDAAAVAIDAWHHTAAYIGLTRLWNAALAGVNAAAAWTGRTARDAVLSIVELLGKVPLFGGLVRRYEAHYEEVNRAPSEPLSERTRDFFARWSVKFTAKYYEDKEREAAAGGHVRA